MASKKEKKKEDITIENSALFQLVLPKYDNSGNPINPEYYNKILKTLTFGTKEDFEKLEKGEDTLYPITQGLTVLPNAYGCWYNKDTGEIQCEENFIVEIVLNKNNKFFEQKLNLIENIDKMAGQNLGQGEMFMLEDPTEESIKIEGKYNPKSKESMKGVRLNVLPEFIR